MLGMDDSYPLPPRLVALLQDLPLEELAFVAVPVRPRHDGWTKVRQQGFIVRLALCGCVTRAAKGVGKTKASAYRLRERPGAGSFAEAWDKAIGWGQDRAIDTALERGLCGEQVPVMRDGRCVGIRHRYDNRLTMAVLNALDRRAARHPLGYDPVQAFERALAVLGPNLTPTENKGFSRPT
jgi:hypothetical protein